MKKLALVVLSVILVFVISACGHEEKVSITCANKVVEVEVDNFMEHIEDYRNACVIPGEEKVEPVIRSGSCHYDYNVMPLGADANGILIADYGIKYYGEIFGPAMIQLDVDDPYTVISLFPGESYVVTPEKDSLVWKYIGNEACLITRFNLFSGKTILRLYK